MKPLTERQQAVWDYIVRTVCAKGRQPVLREIMAEFGIRSCNGAKCHLDALARSGRIVRRKGKQPDLCVRFTVEAPA